MVDGKRDEERAKGWEEGGKEVQKKPQLLKAKVLHSDVLDVGPKDGLVHMT